MKTLDSPRSERRVFLREPGRSWAGVTLTCLINSQLASVFLAWWAQWTGHERRLETLAHAWSWSFMPFYRIWILFRNQWESIAGFRGERLWYNKKINIWSLSLIPGTQLLKPVVSLEWKYCLLYIDEVTGSWGPLNSFSTGVGCQKGQVLIRGLEISASNPDLQGAERG